VRSQRSPLPDSGGRDDLRNSLLTLAGQLGPTRDAKRSFRPNAPDEPLLGVCGGCDQEGLYDAEGENDTNTKVRPCQGPVT